MIVSVICSQGHQPLKPTVPQPFNLTDRKRKLDEQPAAPSKFHSMAEVEKSVFGKTPERFRSKPRNAKGEERTDEHFESQGLDWDWFSPK